MKIFITYLFFILFGYFAWGQHAIPNQIYLCGNGIYQGEPLGWDPASPAIVYENDNRNYVFDIDELVSFKVSKTFSQDHLDWKKWNTGNKRANVTAENLGTILDLVPDDGPYNIDVPWKGNYHIVIDSEFEHITLTTTTPAPEEKEHYDIYIRGDFTNNWAALPQWQFTWTGGRSYEIQCSIKKGAKFKIGDSDWSKINFGYKPYQEEIYDLETWWKYNYNDAIMGEDFTGIISFTLPEDEDYKTQSLLVTFTPSTTEVRDTFGNNQSENYYNLQGMPVLNPRNGLYIVIRGTHSELRLLR